MSLGWTAAARLSIALALIGAATACSDDPAPTESGTDAGVPPTPMVDAGSTPGVDAGDPPAPGVDAGEPPPPPGTARDAADVLFVGHSLVNWRMPAIVDGIAASQPVTHEWAAHIGIGASLSWIWTNPDSGEGENPRTRLATGTHDVLVMTEAIPLEEHTSWGGTLQYGGEFYQAAVAGNPEIQVYMYETWDYRGRGFDWRARLESDRALWAEQVDAINAAHEGPDMLLIPGGAGMAALHDAIAAGRVPGMSDIGEVFEDDIHLTDVGNYFIACVVYATIYRRSPVGAPHRMNDRFGNPMQAPTADQARVFQEIAWEVVASDPRAGIAGR